MTPKIYLIIVTYNAMKWAEKCFSSLRKSSIPVNVIVVDNGSTDGTQEYIKTNFPEVNFIQSPENLGFGKANNIGIEVAYKEGADFFYLMNQDAWIFEDSLEKMLEAYNKYPNKEEIGILSPLHLYSDCKSFELHFEMYLTRNTLENRIFSDLYFHKERELYEMQFINAAHWLLPKKTIEIVGGFNPYFFQGVEDHEYANRVKYFNKKIFLCAKSKVVHDSKNSFLRGDNPENARKVSLIAQRESRFLDPSYNYKVTNEVKRLLSDVLLLALKGNFSESQLHYEIFKHLRPLFSKIQKSRETSMTKKHAFLNL